MLSLRKNSETADTLDSANVSMFPNQKAASLSRVHQMLDSLPVNIMTCELEGLTIDYVYKTSIETLRTLEHHIPSGADDIVGQCIDIFHKHPEHQRQLLSNPDNLPWTTNIRLGDEILELQVSPIFDEEGGYVAPCLVWTVVSEKVETETKMKRLLRMIDSMPINVILADPDDMRISYANQTSIDTLKSLEEFLPCKAEDIVGTCIDDFHKHPEHQRKLLADPANLPHNSKIRLGKETLDLRVSAIMEEDGSYLGSMLAWSVATQFVKMADTFE